MPTHDHVHRKVNMYLEMGMSQDEITAAFFGEERAWAFASIAHMTHAMSPDNAFDRHEYDPEVVELACYIASLPGISSERPIVNSGRRMNPVDVFFDLDGTGDLSGLIFLTRCVDFRYWPHGGEWSLELRISDDVKRPLSFHLSSKARSEAAWEQVQSLIQNMDWHRGHEEFLEGYGLQHLAIV